MKKIFIASKKIIDIIVNNGDSIKLSTSSSCWEQLELENKLILVENKLKTKEDFVPLSEEEAELPPTTKIRWHEERAVTDKWYNLHPWDTFCYGTIAEYKKRKGEVVPSPKHYNHQYEAGSYITKCDNPCRVIEISDSLPVYGIGINGDGSFYGACPLAIPNNSSIEEWFGKSLSLREKFLLAHAMGGKEAIYNLGQELRVPEQIVKEVVDNIDTL